MSGLLIHSRASCPRYSLDSLSATKEGHPLNWVAFCFGGGLLSVDVAACGIIRRALIETSELIALRLSLGLRALLCDDTSGEGEGC